MRGAYADFVFLLSALVQPGCMDTAAPALAETRDNLNAISVAGIVALPCSSRDDTALARERRF
jgi:hypothetical protein